MCNVAVMIDVLLMFADDGHYRLCACVCLLCIWLSLGDVVLRLYWKCLFLCASPCVDRRIGGFVRVVCEFALL